MTDPRKAFITTVLLLTLLLPCNAALSQGTSERLPDPISVTDASRYYRQLQLSEQQRLAAERLFGEYRNRFADLREGTIARALELDSEQFNQRLPSMLSGIADVDESFFQHVEGILADDQMDLLDDVRLMRDRERYFAMRDFRVHSCHSFVDMREALSHVDITAEQRDTIAPMLREHEQQFSRLLATFFRHSAAFPAGDGDEGERLIELGERIRAMNLRMLHQLEVMLQPRQADELRWRFTLAAYVQTRFAARLGVEGQYAAALELPDLTQNQRHAIEAAWQSLRQRRLTIHRKAMENLDTHGRIAIGWDDERFTLLHETRSELAQEASELNKQALAQLHAMFDDETVPKLENAPSGIAAGSEHHFGWGVRDYTFNYARFVPSRPQEEAPAPVADAFIAEPINEAELQFIAAMLNLDQRVQPLLQELHHAYLERFAATAQDLVDEAVRIRAGSMGIGFGEELDEDEREEALRTLERVDQRFASRRRVNDVISGLDADFFRDVAAILPPDAIDETALERARLNRQRQLLERGTFSGYGHWPNRASGVNLSRLIMDRLPPQRTEHLDDVLLEYDRAYVQAARERFEALRERQFLAESGQLRAELGEITFQQRHDDYVAIQDKVRQKHRELAVVNQQHVLRLADKLADKDAALLLDAFNRAAYPRVFEDSLRVLSPLTAAFELDGLTSDQRSELGEIAAAYRPEYHRLTQAMIELTAAFYGDLPAMLGIGSAEQSRIQERFNNDMGRLVFERDEANRQAAQRLRLTLNPDQIRRIGGLPEPGEDRAGRD